MLRTVNSVINRSPPQFLHEVVLVDDKSELEHLHEKLEREIEKPYYKGKVIIVRNKEREGLIRYDILLILLTHVETTLKYTVGSTYWINQADFGESGSRLKVRP